MIRRLALLILLAITAATGCGDDAERGAGTEAPAEDDSILVAALGDSITAGSPLWDPDPAIREAIGPALDERSQFEYWASEADPARSTFRNCGVFGERTDEIAAAPRRVRRRRRRADRAGRDQRHRAGPAGRRGRRLTCGRWSSRDDRLGLPVALADVLPWNNGHPAADAPIEELNREIDGSPRTRRSRSLPFHDTLENPESPGTMNAGLDRRRRPPVDRGLSPPRRACGPELRGDRRVSRASCRAVPRPAARPSRPPASAAARCRTSCRGRRRP